MSAPRILVVEDEAGIRLALSGLLTAAPLQIAEAREATGLPIHDREGLASPDVAIELLGRAQEHLDAQSSGWIGAA